MSLEQWAKKAGYARTNLRITNLCKFDKLHQSPLSNESSRLLCFSGFDVGTGALEDFSNARYGFRRRKMSAPEL